MKPSARTGMRSASWLTDPYPAFDPPDGFPWTRQACRAWPSSGILKRWKKKGSPRAVHTAKDPPQAGQGLGPSHAGGGAGSRAGFPQYGQLRTSVAIVLLPTRGSGFKVWFGHPLPFGLAFPWTGGMRASADGLMSCDQPPKIVPHALYHKAQRHRRRPVRFQPSAPTHCRSLPTASVYSSPRSSRYLPRLRCSLASWQARQNRVSGTAWSRRCEIFSPQAWQMP